MRVTDAEFRAVLGRFASGVTVVTTMREGKPHGVTVNAFASLSLNPPLVLIGMDKASHMHDILLEAGVFAANILSDEQRDLSACFAVGSDRRYRDFCDVRYHAEATGAPVFDSALGWVDCRIVNVYPGGDHSIIVGQVEALGGAEQDPLLYYRGKYGRLDPTAPAIDSTAPTPTSGVRANGAHPAQLAQPDASGPYRVPGATGKASKAAANGASAPDVVGTDGRRT